MIKNLVKISLFISCSVVLPALAQEKIDYTSKVPQYKFSDKLPQQLKELKTNPLMLRFAKSREELAKDPHRPLYHFTSPESRLNDPNGLSFWNGKWHLFYQAYPPEDTRQHWGHAISDDLINWKDLPYAIYPNPERAVYSGSVIIEKDRAIAMYHGTMVGNMVATSSDPLLLNWEKVTGKAVIPLRGPKENPYPFAVYDPVIWKKGDYYYSLSAGKEHMAPSNLTFRANYLFKSKDLINWDYMHEFIEGDRFTLPGDDGACPYFLPIGEKGEKYIMPFFSHMTGGQYLLGDYDQQRDKFVVTSAGKFNFGNVRPGGIHAPSAFSDGKGGVIVIFNMNPGFKTKGWDQIMTLPRRLTLLPNGQIGMEPAGNIESLRDKHQFLENIKIPANKEVVINQIKGNAIEILVEVDVKDAQMFEMNVLRSANKEEYTKISFYKNRGFGQGRKYDTKLTNLPVGSYISLDNSYSSTLATAASRAPETAPISIEKGETLKLRIFIDKSVVEVFVNGKQSVAARVYPSLDDSLGISFRSQGSESVVKSINAYQMKPIY